MAQVTDFSACDSLVRESMLYEGTVQLAGPALQQCDYVPTCCTFYTEAVYKE